jgi:flagellar biosynthetic protein FlhB
MAEGGSEKTEKPTAYKLQKARKQGQVAKSVDLNSALILGAMCLIVSFGGTYLYTTAAGISTHLWSDLTPRHMGVDQFETLLSSVLQTICLLLLPICGGLMVVGAMANVVQIKPLFTLEPLMPKLNKLNPISGFQRMWSMRSIIEVVKAIAKMAAIGACAWMVISSHQGELIHLGQSSFGQALGVIGGIVSQLVFSTFIIMLVVGGADFMIQRWQLEKQLRMTKQEVKEEHKNHEGNPVYKGQMRKRAREMLNKRQLTLVPQADVVITNPTHFSIAIRYDPDQEPAPRIVAKGADHFALKIREVAREHNVPLIENKPLAQSLYKVVEAGHMIPPELFVAVAEVLAFVFSKNKGRKRWQKPV